MKIFKLLTLSFLVIAILSCKNSSGVGKFKTKTGYEYEVHKKGEGTEAKIGDYFFYTMQVATDQGKILNDMTDPYAAMPIKISHPDSLESKGNPWIEVFQKLNVGDSISLYTPTDSMPIPNPDLAGAKTLIYRLKVAEVMNEKQMEEFGKKKQAEMQAIAEEGRKQLPAIETAIKKTIADFKAGKLKSTLSLDQGVKVYINEPGSGAQGADGKVSSVKYYGCLENGEMFDNSFERGQPFDVQVGTGSVIPGWEIALKALKAGDKATIFIPAAAGYGEQGAGTIPPNSPLVFYIEVVSVK
jgi:FKBP-type peptidyl-prolyl cis-trans isomerase FkpA